jgi:hypothetical protein
MIGNSRRRSPSIRRPKVYEQMERSGRNSRRAGIVFRLCGYEMCEGGGTTIPLGAGALGVNSGRPTVLSNPLWGCVTAANIQDVRVLAGRPRGTGTGVHFREPFGSCRHWGIWTCASFSFRLISPRKGRVSLSTTCLYSTATASWQSQKPGPSSSTTSWSSRRRATTTLRVEGFLSVRRTSQLLTSRIVLKPSTPILPVLQLSYVQCLRSIPPAPHRLLCPH